MLEKLILLPIILATRMFVLNIFSINHHHPPLHQSQA